MANEQKDRLGDKLRDAERAREERFFAERDKALLAKLRARTAETAKTAGLPETCPTCGESHTPGEGGGAVCPAGHRIEPA